MPMGGVRRKVVAEPDAYWEVAVLVADALALDVERAVVGDEVEVVETVVEVDVVADSETVEVPDKCEGQSRQSVSGHANPHCWCFGRDLQWSLQTSGLIGLAGFKSTFARSERKPTEERPKRTARKGVPP